MLLNCTQQAIAPHSIWASGGISRMDRFVIKPPCMTG